MLAYRFGRGLTARIRHVTLRHRGQITSAAGGAAGFLPGINPPPCRRGRRAAPLFPRYYAAIEPLAQVAGPPTIGSIRVRRVRVTLVEPVDEPRVPVL